MIEISHVFHTLKVVEKACKYNACNPIQSTVTTESPENVSLRWHYLSLF